MTTIGTTSHIYLRQNGSKIEYKTTENPSYSQISLWPVGITNSGSNTIIVELETDLTITSTYGGTSGYFIVNFDKTTFEGNNKKVTIDTVANYPGLIQNGYDDGSGTSVNGKNYVTIQNLGVVVDPSDTTSTLANYGGWIGQYYFGYHASNNVATNCYSTGGISGTSSGGIFGASSGQDSGNITATNCYSTGNISGTSSGGIFGDGAGQFSGNASATNCYSTGGTSGISGNGSGGIFGSNAGSNSGIANANNCYSTGGISGQFSGGIFGSNAGFLSGNASTTNCYSTRDISGIGSGGIFGSNAGFSGNASATNCYSTGNISGNGSGGIFGNNASARNSGNAYATNCYSTGAITGQYSGGIFGQLAGADSGNASANNCYSTGGISGSQSGGIFGYYAGFLGNATATNCYFNGTSAQLAESGTVTNPTNIYAYNNSWSDATANATLAPSGLPSSNPGIGTTWTSIVANTPYSLSVMQKVIIQSVDPTTPPSAIGISYTITAGTYQDSGTQRTDLSNTSLVTFNGTPATITSKNATTVVVTSPITSTSMVTVVVTTPDGLSQPFYLYTPQVVTFSIPPVYLLPPVPIILIQPESQTAELGQNIQLFVVAEDGYTLTDKKIVKYQWYKNTVPYTPVDVPIPDSNSPILILENITADDEGDYYVFITNKLGGSTISHIAQITVVELNLLMMNQNTTDNENRDEPNILDILDNLNIESISN